MDGGVLRGRRRRHDHRRCCRRRRAAAAPTRTRRCASRRSRPRGWRRSAARTSADARSSARRSSCWPARRPALPTPELAARGIAADAIARLAQRGLISLRQDRVDRDPFDAGDRVDRRRPRPTPDRQLTGEQAARARAARRARRRRGAFRVALLHGVTGSGKTEIYLRLVGRGPRAGPPRADAGAGNRADAGGGRALPRRRSASASPFSTAASPTASATISGSASAAATSTSSSARARRCSRRSRSVGLIIVDEEHDGSYKQEESPRYNGRDVAIVRGAARRRAGRARLGDAVDGELPQRDDRQVRAHRARAPRARSAARRRSRSSTCARSTRPTGPDVILSRALRDGDRTRGSSGSEQALVLLNRRGFATAVFCRQCAGTIDCPNCSVSLVVHGEGNARRARCHYCNYSARVPTACPLCAGPYLEQAGFGTERVEAEVQSALSRRARRAARSRRHPPQGRARRAARRDSATARSTCSSARR